MAANQTKSLQDAVKEQYRKCAQDPVYFMRKFCKIQHPTRGKIPFDLYDFQEGVLNDFKDNRFNVVLKSRQLGISTLVAGYSLWKMIFHADFNVLVIATKQDIGALQPYQPTKINITQPHKVGIIPIKNNENF